ncbi:hypothetical protein FISHEDRAFT_41653 [Fistulina hepatica ATCC 64428]|nr:hypothetical protein FISHEDRAFT_41653 [Fistulina hepatica ATCC 64428]
MPRILPRLIQALNKYPVNTPHEKLPKRRRKVSLYRGPLPPLPSLRPSEHLVSPLIEPENVITEGRLYRRHKRLPPHRWLNQKIKVVGSCDPPREMNEDERRSWANPYLRMLASPIRLCLITGRYFPSDFLVRLAPMVPPTADLSKTRDVAVLVPDGLEHSQFKVRSAGGANHVVCWREAISQMPERRTVSRGPVAAPHGMVAEHVAHLLRVRVLQELELLCDALQKRLGDGHLLKFSAPKDCVVVRRLTRTEWTELKETGVAPYTDAVAIIVCPPPNRDPETKQRPEPNMSATPPPDVLAAACKPLKPKGHAAETSLHPVFSSLDECDGTLWPAQIPLYNTTALFPYRGQRAMMHLLLSRILKSQMDIAAASTGETSVARGKEKPSHAYLVISSSNTLYRADSVPLAIALWRLRMFEGAGYDFGTEKPDERWVTTTW